ncbi:Hypothetical protein GbCGDNIH9_1558 [Granulibacter bethesdensis]|uniref:Secreted protein n=1 Tax=Granulibacter bethesdensis TaxID=364410 RepID=A0AAC9P946_9PROT|nr:hypothetical protein [Granulibacter bethesdensis]APH54845.1 Hypothetical protein GbCGDNIH9_1558 [Granulibacter bethesdensis]APH62431.1 Hypothetical protein GbCGDNIH8_1560a [Granulibacter bethesdensis]
MKYKNLVFAAVLLGSSLSCGIAVADVWDPALLHRLQKGLAEEIERREKKNEAIESKLTPEILEKLRQKYYVPPGPYHLYRGEKENLFTQSFWDELKRRNPKIYWSESHVTINEQGDWFVCMTTEEILNNDIPRRALSIKSSQGWTLYDEEFGGKFLMQIFDKACDLDGEVVE